MTDQDVEAIKLYFYLTACMHSQKMLRSNRIMKNVYNKPDS